MTDLTYNIVEHDGGWAYKVGDTFSETFPSHDAAQAAARGWKSDDVSSPVDRREDSRARSSDMGFSCDETPR